jgi:4-hydroxybenzoate polyprenyltransferase
VNGSAVSRADGLPRRAPAARPRWRAYLLLSRVSNLPTVWSNVLAGSVAAGAAVDATAWLPVAAAASLFYTGGMFLNDAFDEPFDRKARPERPIPSGDVTRTEVFAAGGMCLAAGEALLAPARGPMLFGLALAAAIVLYDVRHKGSRVAPLVMGVCRGLVYCVAASAAGSFTAAALAGAGVMVAYVAGLTVVAKMAGANARWLVPLLIAGISIVDATFIAVVSSSLPLALLAASGFALTLFLQRFVPGD